MRLEKMELSNFQGIEAFEFCPHGENATIFGTNGTGKTTIYNAFTWLLYEKPGTEERGFSPKPIPPQAENRTENDSPKETANIATIETKNGTATESAHGEEIAPAHGMTIDSAKKAKKETEKGTGAPLICSVCAQFTDTDGRTVTLSKSLYEEWTKKRGSGAESFSGHRTECAIDGVPISKGHYEAFISRMFPGELAMILSRPEYFSAILPWQRRREILLDVCGEVSEEEVFEAAAELAPLQQELKRTKSCVKDFKTTASARLKKINERLGLLPSMADEARRAIPPAGVQSLEEMESILETKLAHAAACRDALAKYRKVEGVEERFYSIKKEKEALEKKNRLAMAERQKEMARQRAERATLESEHAEMLAEKGEADRDAEMAQGELDKALAEFERAAAEQQPTSSTCRLCGSALSAEKETAMALAFEREKADRLKAMQKKTAASLEHTKALKARAQNHGELVAALAARVETAKKILHQKEIEAEKEGAKAEKALQELAAISEELSEQLALAVSERAPEIARSTGELEAVQEEIRTLSENITAARLAKAQRARVEELSAEFAELNATGEKYTQLLYLCEVFTRAKVRFLTQRINDHFPGMRFLLFEDQLNGGLRECCEVLLPSESGALVPYAAANSGARIAAGLRIIEVLAGHNGRTLPVFVDNAESFVSLPRIKAQTIRLMVSPKDEKLRIELEGAKIKGQEGQDVFQN